MRKSHQGRPGVDWRSAAALLAVSIGTLLGATAGYFGGRVNDVLEWGLNVFTAGAHILLVLAFAAVLAKGISTVILVLGPTGWTGCYRLIRSEYQAAQPRICRSCRRDWRQHAAHHVRPHPAPMSAT